MKIIADENMPYVVELFNEFGDIEFVDGRHLTPEQAQDADVLLVRSITKVNAALLEQNQQLKFVGSATIGTDHVDIDYLDSRNIPFSNAPGCNATAVGEYAFIAMLELATRCGESLKDKVVGIVGAGNTGSATAKCLEAYGVKVMLCDPIKQQEGDERAFYSLEQVLAEADVISLHVPITKDGEHKTWFLFDEARLAALKPNTWLLNCCRGEVIDNNALIKVGQQRSDLKLVLDVWQGEPNPITELVPLVDIATPHIAGYSLEGKAKGTFMLYEKLCQLTNTKVTKTVSDLLPPFHISEFSLSVNADLLDGANQAKLLGLARMAYDVRDDDVKFRQRFAQLNGFDQMRKQHKHRREFSALTLNFVQAQLSNEPMLAAEQLGFKVT
ncbi:4-phosphoerythronate dehydrogenase [Shewanella maritima]|uniref:Erythronate-4-phosphate dehydrogenase n=1 Tax=Shewanella maritima TaxID=2520507 RepID=A0A411PDV6_9GAMM|nr:4-phosphoerythronate dehydrogenase [Shewanella maritima]QBF81711.1 4-phosphoerythronate dehydrogenase [Shewanella maritima]